MLNPKLLELYGEESRKVLAGVVAIVSRDNKDSYYAVTKSSIKLGDFIVPEYIKCITGVKKEIQDGMDIYTSNITDGKSKRSIRFIDGNPEDGDVKIYLEW